MITKLFKRLKSFFRQPSQREIQQSLRKKGMKIGDNCRIFSDIDGPECYLISLGNNVTIATGARLITHDNSISKVLPSYTDLFGRISLEDNVFIGAYSTILCGVTVGSNSIIAAGSPVCKSIPKNEIWGGVPAKRIGLISDFAIRMKPWGINTRGLSYEEKKGMLLNTDKLIKK